MDTTQYIAKRYFDDDTPAGVQSVERILNIPGVRCFGTPAQGCVALYISVSDFALSLLRNVQTDQAFTVPFMLSMLQYPGDNTLIFLCVADGAKSIRRMARAFIYSHKPSRLLWFDSKRTFLHEYQVSSWAKV